MGAQNRSPMQAWLTGPEEKTHFIIRSNLSGCIIKAPSHALEQIYSLPPTCKRIQLEFRDIKAQIPQSSAGHLIPILTRVVILESFGGNSELCLLHYLSYRFSPSITPNHTHKMWEATILITNKI